MFNDLTITNLIEYDNGDFLFVGERCGTYVLNIKDREIWDRNSSIGI